MRRQLVTTFAVAAALTIAGCEGRPDEGPVLVSAIGGPVALANPNSRGLSHAQRTLLGATAQGLVRFDAAGQIEPGIAERWIVIDDGRSYIFRLDDVRWPDDSPVTAQDVVTALQRAVAARNGNALGDFLSAIDEIVAMTPRVIEIRLSSPRPDLLSLLAQPELAVFRARGLTGSGPFRMIENGDDRVLLRPAPHPATFDEDEMEGPTPEDHVALRGERAALAIARFVERQADLVTGGSWLDWPIVQAADVASPNLRVDPAAGLFGLSIVRRTGFLADPANRTAIAMAIDRSALTAAFGTGWEGADTLLPAQLDSATPPQSPQWSGTDLATRRLAARARVLIWTAANPDAAPLRLAMPDGPGARMVWAYLDDAFRRIGLVVERVAEGAPADMRLIDRVAPYDSGRWYLATACAPCGEEAAELIDAARTAARLDDRRLAIARADAALAADMAFIPIARPLRWSLVSARLQRFQPNSRAWHPLNHLRPVTN